MTCVKCGAPYKTTIHTIDGPKVNGYTIVDGARMEWICAKCYGEEGEVECG